MGVVFLVLGLMSVFENLGSSLENDTQKKGVIKSAYISTKSKKVGAFPFFYKKTDILEIELASSKQLFWIYNPGQNYADLISSLEPGKSVKLFFDKGEKDNTLIELHQIDLGGLYLIDFDYYKNNQIKGSLIIVVLGIFYLIMLAWLIKYKKVLK